MKAFWQSKSKIVFRSEKYFEMLSAQLLFEHDSYHNFFKSIQSENIGLLFEASIKQISERNEFERNFWLLHILPSYTSIYIELYPEEKIFINKLIDFEVKDIWVEDEINLYPDVW